MPTRDGTIVSRDLELNRKAAADSRKRKRIKDETTELVVKTLYQSLFNLTQQVIEAAQSQDPQAALLSLAASLPSQDKLVNKLQL